jgi:hypothetical protein
MAAIDESSEHEFSTADQDLACERPAPERIGGQSGLSGTKALPASGRNRVAMTTGNCVLHVGGEP